MPAKSHETHERELDVANKLGKVSDIKNRTFYSLHQLQMLPEEI